MPEKDDFFGNDSGAEVEGSDEASLDDFFQPAVTQPKPKPPPPPKASPPPPPPKATPPPPPPKAAPPPPKAAPPPPPKASPPPPPPKAAPPPPPAQRATPPPPPPSPPPAQKAPPPPKPQSSVPLPPRKAAPPPPPPPPPKQPEIEAQPFPEYEEPSLIASLRKKPATQEPLFPIEKGLDLPPLTTDMNSGDDEVPAMIEEPPKASKPGFFDRIPRLAVIITGVVIGAMLSGGGIYFGLNYYSKKKAAQSVKPEVASSPIIAIEKPTTETPITPAGKQIKQPQTPPKPTGAAPKTVPVKVTGKPPEPPKTTVPTKTEAKPYTPKPLPALPPIKSVSTPAWSVALERLALETSIARDAELVRKAGFQPFRVIENRSVSLTEHRLIIDFPNSNDAYALAWKVDKLGYRPEVAIKGRGATVTLAIAFSGAEAEKIRSDLSKQGISNIKIVTAQTTKRLQSLRAGPFNSDAEAQKAAEKLKGTGFPNSVVMRGK